jgi:dipeptidase
MRRLHDTHRTRPIPVIWITLQRAKTAREAIAVMANLTSAFGYASTGESFSIADPNEVWLLELIGKGPGEVGAVWVAVRIPDGYVTGHANQARIRTFPLSDPDAAVYAPDLFDFVVRKGLYPASARPEDFSFSDVFDPVGFSSARFCEVRVWAFFNQINSGMAQYLDYVQGQNLTNRMPLYVLPDRPISLNDTLWFMRTHFENTWYGT